MPTTDCNIHLDSPEKGRQLRQFLQESGYDVNRVSSLIGGRGLLPLLLHKTRLPNRLNTLLRWFVIGRAVEENTAGGLVPLQILELLLSSGLLLRRNGSLVPVARLLPFGDVVTACDPAYESGEDPPPDVVLGPNAPAERLLRFSVRRKVGSALDLCCGGGIHALNLAAHSDTVVASDLNPRALAFARFNARLHGAENIEFVEGDGFSTVAGRRFDLIVSNPPFYLLPATDFLFRDNPVELDGFVRELARQAPRYLNEGGFFQMFFEWAEIEGQPWRERLSGWVADSGCDVWVLRNYGMAPDEYCEERLRHGGPALVDRDVATLAEWAEYYARHKVAAVGGGQIAMRKRSGVENWVSMEEAPPNTSKNTGDMVESFFNAQDLAGAGDETLLAARPRLSPEVHLQQISHLAEQGWLARSRQLATNQGLLRTCDVDPPVAAFLSHVNGKQTLRELLPLLPPQPGITADQMRLACMNILRLLIRRGFVLAD
jgi:SAM-dependent methyltransferase